MGHFNKQTYIIKDYQKEKPFSSFLTGIAGKMGKPLWGFYINRGQALTSFGQRDKNGAIQEFYPGNLAYIYTATVGFRTFIKVDDKVHEFFKEVNPNQFMHVDRHQISIEEISEELGIKIYISYYTLPNMSFAGLARKVTITNLKSEKRDITLIDGLAQILPSGIDYGGYKAVSNLLQSWMLSLPHDDFMFYKLSASTGDHAEVTSVDAGNYYFTKFNQKVKSRYVYDYKLVFKNDSSFETPYGLLEDDIMTLMNKTQAGVNQVPSAYTLISTEIDKEFMFISVLGNIDNKEHLETILKPLSFKILNNKQEENKKLHDSLLKDVETETKFNEFDEYLKQCYLDNLMRGGIPLPIETKDGFAGYHVYSRKHGDLERDYNFFSLEPAYYSQGNGNFRDVLQNRRNDLFFYPEIKDFNIYQFGNLIQADGYNPLSIEGIKFNYEGPSHSNGSVNELLQKSFTLGPLAQLLENMSLDVENEIKSILKESRIEIEATFGEGYWQDHFTYLYDLIESYLAIYPDLENQLFFEDIKYRFFESPASVRPRIEKTVLNNSGNVRQYDSIKHIHKQSKWLKNSKDEFIYVNLIGKLITLILNKFGALDPFSIGIMYEAGKPGWNDAMNGLPGLFGSGVGETIELQRLVKLVKKVLSKHPKSSVFILKQTSDLANNLKVAISFEDRISALENYRETLNHDSEVYEFNADTFINLFEQMEKTLKEGIRKAKKINPIYPTYLTYEVKSYDNLNKVGEYGLPLLKANEYSLHPIAPFLEAPARYLSRLAKNDEAKEMYESIKKTELYDEKLKFYQTSVSLTDEPEEIGRIKAFQKGWLERESNFLHMTYKYLLSMFKAGLYDEFYEEIKTNFTCFMDPQVYGRNPLENSSFIVTSSNPDASKHGEGFVARLSGSTAEMLSIWRYMFFGKDIFGIKENQLTFNLNPKIHHSFFKNGEVSTHLFRNTKITYIKPDNIKDFNTYIEKYEVEIDGEVLIIEEPLIIGKVAESIRHNKVTQIKAYIQGGKK